MFEIYQQRYALSNVYPNPKYKKIIEPFGKVPFYSFENYDKDVMICVREDEFFKAWCWLKEKATAASVLKSKNIEELFQNFDSEQVAETKQFIAENLHKIKHWEISDYWYYNLRNEQATWFLDPLATERFIDWEHFEKWCSTRKGQYMVLGDQNFKFGTFKPFSGNKMMWSNFPIDKQVKMF